MEARDVPQWYVSRDELYGSSHHKRSCGCRIMAITLPCQGNNGSSILLTRSIPKTLDFLAGTSYNRSNFPLFGKFMLMSNLKKLAVVLAGLLACVCMVFPIVNKASADQEVSLSSASLSEDNFPGGHNLPASVVTVQNNSFVSNNSHFASELQTIYVVLTAYSSTAWQTDDTPFITASGTTVRDGIVAANFLPFGTKIRIPELFGDKIFLVEDRMSADKKYQIDVWFPGTQQAVDFGAHLSYIEILS